MLSLSPAALAARKQALANPPVAGRLVNLAEMVKEAKKEGSLNTIALPRDWANYGEMMDTFAKKYGIKITNDNPDGSSAQENQAIRSLKGDSRAPDCVDVGVVVRDRRCERGVVRQVLPEELQDDPAGDEGHAWVLDGRLLGRDLDRLQPEPRLQPAEDVEGPAQARVQGQGRAQRQSAHVQLGRLRRDRSGDGERR